MALAECSLGAEMRGAGALPRMVPAVVVLLVAKECISAV